MRNTYDTANQLDSNDCDPNKQAHKIFSLVANIVYRYHNQLVDMFVNLLPMRSMYHFENIHRKYICSMIHYLDRIFHLYRILRHCNSISAIVLYRRRIPFFYNNNSHGHIGEYNLYYYSHLCDDGQTDRDIQCQHRSFGPHLS